MVLINHIVELSTNNHKTLTCVYFLLKAKCKMDSATAAACLAQSSFVDILLIFVLTFVDIGFAHKEDAKMPRNGVKAVVNNQHEKEVIKNIF